MDLKISIILVNYNGKKWLKGLFDSIKNQTYQNYEVIFVDNNSNDGSVEYVTKNFSKTHIIKNETNSGFAGGNQAGLKVATGDYLLLLNTDTTFEKNFIKDFIKAFSIVPNLAIAQSRLLLMDDPKIIDTCGSFWTNTSFLYHYGNGKNETKKAYSQPFPVFSVKAASVLINKKVVDKIGLFDEDFWSYYEETDFCHRAWNAGYKCLYWPDATCFHKGGGTTLEHFNNAHIQFHNFKNKLLSFIKNFQIKTLVFVIPKFLVINILLSVLWLLKGKYLHTLSLYKAIWWNIVNLQITLRKRNIIQKHRKKSDLELFSKVKRNPKHLSYYYYLFQDRIGMYED